MIKILWIDAIDYRFEIEKRYQPLGIFKFLKMLKMRAAIPHLE